MNSKKLFSQLQGIVVCAVVSFSAHAIPFTNGDFSAGSAGWNDASDNGSTSIVGGVAQLVTGDGTSPFSSILVQGDSGFFDFTNPVSLGADHLYLNFDVQISSVADVTETVSPFVSDYLTVAVYDSVDFFYDLVFTEGSTIFDDFDADNSWQRVSLDVSSLAGREVALSFEVTDANDGMNTTVLLDNILFSLVPDLVVAVPEPGSAALLLIGLLLIVVASRQHRVRQPAPV